MSLLKVKPCFRVPGVGLRFQAQGRREKDPVRVPGLLFIEQLNVQKIQLCVEI